MGLPIHVYYILYTIPDPRSLFKKCKKKGYSWSSGVLQVCYPCLNAFNNRNDIPTQAEKRLQISTPHGGFFFGFFLDFFWIFFGFFFVLFLVFSKKKKKKKKK